MCHRLPVASSGKSTSRPVQPSCCVSPADLLGRNPRLGTPWSRLAFGCRCLGQASDVCRMNKAHSYARLQRHRRRVGQGIRVSNRLERNRMCVGGGRGFPSFLSLHHGMLGKGCSLLRSLVRMKLALQQLAGAVVLQEGRKRTGCRRIVQRGAAAVSFYSWMRSAPGRVLPFLTAS